MFYKRTSPSNIINGFEASGLVPFNPARPDYSKCEGNAAQKECSNSVFVGIDQGGYTEAATQTLSDLQTVSTMTEDDGSAYLFGSLNKNDRVALGYTDGSLDDSILDVKKFGVLKCLYSYDKKHPFLSLKVRSMIYKMDSTHSSQIEKESTISPSFKTFRYFPSPLKKATTISSRAKKMATRVGPITGTHMKTILSNERRNKKIGKPRVLKKKTPTEATKKKTPTEATKKKAQKRIVFESSSNTSSSAEDTLSSSSEDEMALPIQKDSSTSSTMDEETYCYTKIPVKDGFVAVKVPIEGVKNKQEAFKICFGQIFEVGENGIGVNFLIKKNPGFYVWPDKEDHSFVTVYEVLQFKKELEWIAISRQFGVLVPLSAEEVAARHFNNLK